MRTLKTYCEIIDYIEAFSKKEINLLLIISRGGLGKTTLAEEVLIKTDPLIFKGHVTPLAMYKELYIKSEEEKDCIVIFDDVDSLLQSKTNIALLKQICETRENKIIRYSSTSHLLRKESQHNQESSQIPQEFETSCKVLVLINDVDLFKTSPALKALLTRAHIIFFEPADEEVLSQLQTFGKDIQIIDFLKKYIRFSENMNFRVYERAKELKKSNLNWKDEILTSLKIDSKLFELNMLLERYPTDKERLQHFSGSRITFYRTKKKFLNKVKG